jgi:hypothetical protein
MIKPKLSSSPATDSSQLHGGEVLQMSESKEGANERGEVSRGGLDF